MDVRLSVGGGAKSESQLDVSCIVPRQLGNSGAPTNCTMRTFVSARGVGLAACLSEVLGMATAPRLPIATSSCPLKRRSSSNGCD